MSIYKKNPNFTVEIWLCDIFVSNSTEAEVEWAVTSYHYTPDVSIVLCNITVFCVARQ